MTAEREAMTLAEAREVVADVYSDFCNPNFTDRHGDKPRLKAAIAAIDVHLSHAAEPVALKRDGTACTVGEIAHRQCVDPTTANAPEPARDAKVADAMVREACAAFSRSFNDKTFPECMRLALEAAMAQESGE